MRGDNFKPVSAETSSWVLQQHFAMQDVPIDVCGPVSVSGVIEPQERKEPVTRMLPGESKIAFFCRKAGITEEEREEYVWLVYSKRMTASEALRIVIANRRPEWDQLSDERAGA